MNYKKYRPKHLSNTSRQQGWTFWSLMFVMGVIILFSYVGLQLFPLYTGNSNVKSAMVLAIDNSDPSTVSRAAIIRSMRDKLYLDGSHKLIDYKNDLVVKRTKREFIINVNYERRVHLFFNLSLVTTFENEEKRDL